MSPDVSPSPHDTFSTPIFALNNEDIVFVNDEFAYILLNRTDHQKQN